MTTTVSQTGGPRRSWWLLPVLAAIVVFGAAFLRQDGVPKDRTVWAEDGQVFAQCMYDSSAVRCIPLPYQGYLSTAPRIGAVLATAGRPHDLPFLLALTAGAMAAVGAWLVARAVRDVTASPLAGVLAAISLALVFQAGREVLGNLANLHWILLSASSVVLVAGWFGRGLHLADLGLVAITAVSSAMAPILPILALGGVVARAPRAVLSLGVALVATLPQVVVLIVAERSSRPDAHLTLRKAVAGFTDLVIGAGWFGPDLWPLNIVVAVLAVGLVVAVGANGRRRRRTAGPESGQARDLFVASVAMAALIGLGVMIFFASVGINGVINPRYGYVAAALTGVAIALGVGFVVTETRATTTAGLDRRLGAGAIPAVAVGTIFVVGYVASFRLDARASIGPDVVAGMEAARAVCATMTAGRVEVFISPLRDPPSWRVEVPCQEFDD